MLRGLLIRHPWIGKILDGKKTWEIRGSRTFVKEQIALIASGSGTVVGMCHLDDCVGPLTPEKFRRNAKKAGIRPAEATLGHYRRTYAWVMKDVRKLDHPVRYKHPSGAVIWVRLEPAVEKKIRAQLGKWV